MLSGPFPPDGSRPGTPGRDHLHAGPPHGAPFPAGSSLGIRKLVRAQGTVTVSASDTYYTSGRLPGPSSVWLEPASPRASWGETPSEKPRQQSSLYGRRREVPSHDETFGLPFFVTAEAACEEDVTALCDDRRWEALATAVGSGQGRQRREGPAEPHRSQFPRTGRVTARHEAAAQSYRHGCWGEGQVLQGPQDSVLSAEEEDGSMNSHFCHCSREVTATGTSPQQWQLIGHKGRCEKSHVRGQARALSDEFLQGLALLERKCVSVLNRVQEKTPGVQRAALTSVTRLVPNTQPPPRSMGLCQRPLRVPGEDKLHTQTQQHRPKLTHRHSVSVKNTFRSWC